MQHARIRSPIRSQPALFLANRDHDPHPLPPRFDFLHWFIFLLFVIALATIEYRGEVPKGDPLRDTLKTVHMLAGQLVFLAAAVAGGGPLPVRRAASSSRRPLANLERWHSPWLAVPDDAGVAGDRRAVHAGRWQGGQLFRTDAAAFDRGITGPENQHQGGA